MSVTISSENLNPLETRVIESLRSGVPGTSAIKELGSNQPHITATFEERLGGSVNDGCSTGFIVEAAFGCGKSHLLASLRQTALDNNFACSIVSVSKEMTLATITHVFLSAIRELRLPRKAVGGSCAEFIDSLQFNSQKFARLVRKYSDDEDSVGSIFGASLRLFESYQGQPDVLETMIEFWDGGRCPFADIKRDLKAIDLPYKHLKAPRETTLGLARLQFVTDLLRGAGYAGWVVLVDEGEMIAKLSLMARAKSYANLASLLGTPELATVDHLVTVVAITNDLWYELLTVRDDQTLIDIGLRRTKPQLADAALRALTYLYDTARRFQLTPITPRELLTLRSRVAQIYSKAYPGSVIPRVDSLPNDSDSRNVRSHIKEWITDWDLRQTYSGYVPNLSEREVSIDLSENFDYVESPDGEAK